MGFPIGSYNPKKYDRCTVNVEYGLTAHSGVRSPDHTVKSRALVPAELSERSVLYKTRRQIRRLYTRCVLTPISYCSCLFTNKPDTIVLFPITTKDCSHVQFVHKKNNHLPQKRSAAPTYPAHIFCRIPQPILRGPLSGNYFLVPLGIIFWHERTERDEHLFLGLCVLYCYGMPLLSIQKRVHKPIMMAHTSRTNNAVLV